MKKLLILFTVLAASVSFAFGQAPADSITMKKVFGGYQFFQNEKMLSMPQLTEILKSNEQAYKEFSAAKSSNSVAMVFGVAGGALIGWPLGTAVGGGDPNWILAGIGAGLVGISIPFTQKFNSRAKIAVDTYNDRDGISSIFDRTELRLAVSGNGVGLVLQF